MAIVTYKSCSVGGSAAQKTQIQLGHVADLVANFQLALTSINDLIVPRVDESITLKAQQHFPVLKIPVAAIDLYEKAGKQGFKYRTNFDYFNADKSSVYFKFDRTTSDAVASDSGNNSKDASAFQDSVDTIELILDANGNTAAAGGAPLRPIQGIIPNTHEGPFGQSAVFSNKNYFAIEQNAPVIGIPSDPLNMKFKEAILLFGWLRVDTTAADGHENVICSFASSKTDATAKAATVSPLNSSDPPPLPLITDTIFNLIKGGTPYAIHTFYDFAYAFVPPMVLLGGPIGLALAAFCPPIQGSSALQHSLMLANNTFFNHTLEDHKALFDGNGLPPTLKLFTDLLKTVPASAFPIVTASVPPETSHNTLYAVSVNASNKLVFSWEYAEKKKTHFTSSFLPPIVNGKFYFFAAERFMDKQDGTVTIDRYNINPQFPISTGTQLHGTGTKFTAFQPLDFIKIGVDENPRQIQTIVSDTELELVEAYHTTITADTPAAIFSLTTTVYLGDDTGNLATESVTGLPFAQGGGRNSFFIGKQPDTQDESDPANVKTINNYFEGSLGLLGIRSALPDKAEDRDILVRDIYRHSFPDYVQDGRNVSRTLVSKIPENTEVFGNYNYRTTLAEMASSSNEAVTSVDTILQGSLNDRIKNLTQLAQNLGTLDPSKLLDIPYLENYLTKFGMTLANGKAFVNGQEDTFAYNQLIRFLNNNFDLAKQLTTNQESGTFVTTASLQQSREINTVDSCGVPVTQLEISDKLIAVNTPLGECVRLAGVQTIEELKVGFWWLDKVPDASTGIVQRLRNFDFTPTQISSILDVLSIDNITTYLIPNKNLPNTITGSAADIQVLIQDRTTNGITAAPNLAQIGNALNNVIDAVPPATTDGTRDPLVPATLVAAVIDPQKTFEIDTSAAEAAVNAAEESCRSIFIVLASSLDSLRHVFDSVQAVIAPISLQLSLQVNLLELSMSRHIPCLLNVTANAGGGVLSAQLAASLAKIAILQEQVKLLKSKVTGVGTSSNALACVPETIINAILGGVCGFEVPQSKCREIAALYDMMLRMRALILAFKKMILRLLNIFGDIDLSLEITKASLVSVKIDMDSCASNVASFVRGLLPIP